MAAQGNRWKLEDAKAKFSELVRRANAAGPQRVTVRGKEEAVVLSARDFARLQNDRGRKPLVEFLEGLPLDGLVLARDEDRGRDIAF